jgi:hypothetical protein
MDTKHTGHPPKFSGSNFAYWKARMIIYLKSIDFAVWKIVEAEYSPPTAAYETWTEREKRTATLDAKAMNALYCAIDEEEYSRISTCETAHEVWHALEVLHEGTNKVKEAKISALVHKYELFKMAKGETIKDMFSRFTTITNGMKSMGKTYSMEEKVRKILRSLTSEWERKTTAIEEANDLKVLTLDELIGNLMAYEVQIQERRREEEEEAAPKKKNIAFKATSDSESEDEDDEMAMITRRFKKFMKKDKFFKKRFDSKKEIKCFQCKKPGHIMANCPLLKNKSKVEEKPKKKFFKKKAFEAQWDDSDSSSEEETSEEEVANMCFMAHLQESDEQVSDFTFEELLDAFQELYEESRKLGSKNKMLKTENASLISQNDSLQKEISILKKENNDLISDFKMVDDQTKGLKSEVSTLREKTSDLMQTVLRFTKGKENFEKLLSSQKVSFYRTGLGYNVVDKKPSTTTKFVKSSEVKKESHHAYMYARSHAHAHSHIHRSHMHTHAQSHTITRPKSSYHVHARSHSHRTHPSSDHVYIRSHDMYFAISRSLLGFIKTKKVWVPSTNIQGPKSQRVPSLHT